MILLFVILLFVIELFVIVLASVCGRNAPSCRQSVTGEVVAADQLIPDPLKGTPRDAVRGVFQQIRVVRPCLCGW